MGHRYPRVIKVGSAAVKIYRVKHRTAAGRFVYELSYTGANGVRKKPQFADEGDAEKEARLQASKLAKGYVEASEMTVADRNELLAIRRLCNGTPAIAAVQEWAEARDITGGQILPAVKAWAVANVQKFAPIPADVCVDRFIAEREKAGTDAERTYRSKLKPIKEKFAKRELHTISTAEWQAYLGQWSGDGVTHNDFRKRALTMCLWARRQGFLPRGVELELLMTDKMEEENPGVGIIRPDTWGRLMIHLKRYHAHHLAAAVIAGFLGVRSDEIHGKRKDKREKRQVWEDVHLSGDEPLLTVTNAKENTPSWRTVPICAAAVAWLQLCPGEHRGAISMPGAMERVRDIGLAAGLKLPENCFRHSYISYQVVLTGNKHQVSTWAGNSVKEIDKRYRRPVFAESGQVIDIELRMPVTSRLPETGSRSRQRKPRRSGINSRLRPVRWPKAKGTKA